MTTSKQSNYSLMSRQEISNIVETLFKENFSVSANQFSWEMPLEHLDKKFELLSYLIFLEQLLQSKFHRKIPLLENINTAVHTPKDVLAITINTLEIEEYQM